MPSPHYHHLSEKSQPSRPEVITRNSMDAHTAGPRRSTSLKNRSHDDTNSPPQHEPESENAAVAGLLRTIQRPLSTIGRIFSDSDTSAAPSSSHTPSQRSSSTPLAPNNTQTPQQSGAHERFPGQHQVYSVKPLQHPPRGATTTSTTNSSTNDSTNASGRGTQSASDAAVRASVEAEQARLIHAKEHAVVVETLAGMFPQLDREVISDVVREKEGRYVHLSSPPFSLCGGTGSRERGVC